MQRRGVLREALAWIDFGVALAGSSGAVALRYFKESPVLLGVMDQAARPTVLAAALELADHDANVAWEFFRVSPELVTVLPPEAWPTWMAVASELAETDFTLAVEYVRQLAAIAPVLPVEEVRSWAALGLKLITQNSLGKPDYLGVLEYFRTSPAILADIPEPSVRPAVIRLSAQAAQQSPEAGIAILAEAPAIIRRLPTTEWRQDVLRYGVLVAERDADATLAYMRRSPELVALIGDAPGARDKFQAWFSAGMEVLEYSNEAGRAYFAVETEKALGAVSQALSGVPLRQVARRVKLFVEALCGRDVRIQEVPESLEPATQLTRATITDDGHGIGLPSLVRRYETYDENVRLYMVMAAHEAGHLEFGSFDLSTAVLEELAQTLAGRYAKPTTGSCLRLGELFSRYPQPGLIKDLWTVVEDARVEFLLRQEYPGLARDLAAVAKDAVATRSFSHGVTVREMVVDQLLLLSTSGPEAVAVPEPVKAEVEQLWSLFQEIYSPSATAESAVRLANRLYEEMDRLLARRVEMIQGEAESDDRNESLPAPRAAEDLSDTYRPMENWDYRGAMDPDLVRDRSDSAPQPATSGSQGMRRVGVGWPGRRAAGRPAQGLRGRSRFRTSSWRRGADSLRWWKRCWPWKGNGPAQMTRRRPGPMWFGIGNGMRRSKIIA
ncbi:MAG: hypothetical protein U0231_02350 [Nitrospiraceae bacterium]